MLITKSTRSAKNWNANSRLKINMAVMLSWYWQRKKEKNQKTSKKSDRVDHRWSYSRRFGQNIVSTFENLESIFDESNHF